MLSTRSAFFTFSFITSLFIFLLSTLWEIFRHPTLTYLTHHIPLPTETLELFIITPSMVLIPVTHIVGSLRYTHNKWFSRPLKGGFYHVILQAATWTLYSIALCMVLGSIFLLPGLAGVISSAGLVGLFAQGMMVSSLLTFEKDDTTKEERGRQRVKRSSSRSKSKSSSNSRSSKSRVKKKIPASLSIDPSSITSSYDPTNLTSIPATHWASTPSSPPPSPSHLLSPRRPQKRNLILWALMNYGLLQTPYLLHAFTTFILSTCKSCSTGLSNVPALFTLIATLFIPILTHGIGGVLFYGKNWTFYHPNRGGRIHVISQAVGWTLVSVAVLMQMANFFVGTEFGLLVHSGNFLGWCAEGALLYSLSDFREGGGGIEVKDLGGGRKCRGIVEYVVAVGQDMFMTNLHWMFVFWYAGAPFGLNVFSRNPMERMFEVTPLEGALNFVLCVVLGVIPSLCFPYSAVRKPLDWKHPVSCAVKLMETILVSPFGLFRDPMIVFEDDEASYKRNKCMFAIAPHGTLPLSVWALWHQRCDIFDEVCLFFGSQIGMIPGYRLWTGARGGCMTVTKKNLINVMKTSQNVALVPGGVSEMMKCEPHAKNINVSIKHKGFVRIAMQQGFDLAPIVMLHENDMYDNPMRDFQLWCYKKTKVPMGLPYYTNKWFLPMSNQKPLRVVVGKRIKVKKVENPTKAQVEALHRKFYEEVVRCWGKHKKSMGYEDRELTFVM
ncbi:hypothetical protein TrST_g2059 [Triparma strigata]|uniref:Acyltransferase n=1 Tax=Triparma strigata TaxID=1606541 RepID=A0A9W7AGL1_9STRA|nr:hypothetical protein TrST_g2059 [Triparma strigata]